MADMERLLEEIHERLVDAAELVVIEPVGDAAALCMWAQVVANSAGALLRRVAAKSVSSQQWADDGYRSAGSWFAAVTGTGTGRSGGGRVVREGQAMTAMPAADAAAVAGRLDETRLAQLVRCRSRAPQAYSTELDAALVTVATEGTWDDFVVAVRAFHERCDAETHPDRVDDQGQAVPAPSAFQLSQTFDGRWHGTLDLSPDDGALLHAVLDKSIHRYLRAKRDGDPSLQQLDMAAIRAHALVDLADTNLRREPGERSHPNRYSIALTLHAQPDGTWQPQTRIPPGATCDATFYRAVLGQTSEILDIGRATRSWDGPIGTAIRQRDQTCRFPGCDQPPQRCDIHHCTPWEHGGQTTITNGILLCRHHHTFIHANNWHITLDHHQQPTFTKPDGTTNQPPRPPTWPPTKHPTDPPATDDDRTSGDERATGNDHGPSHRDRTSAR